MNKSIAFSLLGCLVTISCASERPTPVLPKDGPTEPHLSAQSNGSLSSAPPVPMVPPADAASVPMALLPFEFADTPLRALARDVTDIARATLAGHALPAHPFLQRSDDCRACRTKRSAGIEEFVDEKNGYLIVKNGGRGEPLELGGWPKTHGMVAGTLEGPLQVEGILVQLNAQLVSDNDGVDGLSLECVAWLDENELRLLRYAAVPRGSVDQQTAHKSVQAAGEWLVGFISEIRGGVAPAVASSGDLAPFLQELTRAPSPSDLANYKSNAARYAPGKHSYHPHRFEIVVRDGGGNRRFLSLAMESTARGFYLRRLPLISVEKEHRRNGRLPYKVMDLPLEGKTAAPPPRLAEPAKPKRAIEEQRCFDWSEASCPPRRVAKGHIPSECHELLDGILSDGRRNGDACCYQVKMIVRDAQCTRKLEL